MKQYPQIGIAILSMISMNTVMAQSNAPSTFESTATIENTCQIEAQDINFGNVSLPLSTQGANSNMTVLCSNNAPYEIELSYGGVYGAGTQSKTYSIKYKNMASHYGEYHVYDSEGVKVNGYLSCYQSDSQPYIRASPEIIAALNLKGDPKIILKQSDNPGICSGRSIVSNSVTVGSPAYAYGVMNGVSKGDALAYKITTPGDISKVWNKANNSYKGTGTGDKQVIGMNAQIIPINSSSLYLAQDSYRDVVTAIINY